MPTNHTGRPRPESTPDPSPRVLCCFNRCRRLHIDVRRLRNLTLTALREPLGLQCWTLGIHLVTPRVMAQLNQRHLGHEGPTDVISFDLRETADSPGLHGEIFVCPDVALDYARRHRLNPGTELLRYIVHGVLHLCGHDDHDPAARRRMKRVENRLIRRLAPGRGSAPIVSPKLAKRGALV